MAVPSCASDPDPCLPVVPKDQVQITIGSGVAPCAELGLQDGAMFTTTVRDFGAGPTFSECLVNCHECLFVNADVEPLAGFTWTWLGGLRGEVSGYLGGRYRLTRADGCSGSMEAALEEEGFSTPGKFKVNYTPDPDMPAACPSYCMNSFPASSRKL